MAPKTEETSEHRRLRKLAYKQNLIHQSIPTIDTGLSVIPCKALEKLKLRKSSENKDGSGKQWFDMVQKSSRTKNSVLVLLPFELQVDGSSNGTELGRFEALDTDTPTLIIPFPKKKQNKESEAVSKRKLQKWTKKQRKKLMVRLC